MYIINPFNHGTAMADICAAFWQLVQNYIAGMDKQQGRRMNEVVLQIVPLDFITSSESIVVPTQAEYLNLALEVYSRCSQKSTTGLLGFGSPVVISESIPSIINFKLSPERTSPFREGRSLHLAYSRSLDQRWITVAWTDNTGSFQKTMSYCLRFRGSNGVRSVSHVRNEIWATTRSIIEMIQILGRVMLVSTEPMDQDEIEGKSKLFWK